MVATEREKALNKSITANAEQLLESKPLCFVISRIGDEGSPERKFANTVLKHVIKKALDSKYRIERADDIGKPGLITVQIIQRLAAAELVVADLTGGNANVYYELALRHYFAKPVVHIIQRGERAPFDVSPMRYVEFELTVPDSLDAAREEIQKQVAAMQSGENVVTLVQVAKVMTEAAHGAEGEAVVLMKALYGAVGNVQQAVENVAGQVSAVRVLGQEVQLVGSAVEELSGVVSQLLPPQIGVPGVQFPVYTRRFFPGFGVQQSWGAASVRGGSQITVTAADAIGGAGASSAKSTEGHGKTKADERKEAEDESK
jgi:hypothetical protein